MKLKENIFNLLMTLLLGAGAYILNGLNATISGLEGDIKELNQTVKDQGEVITAVTTLINYDKGFNVLQQLVEAEPKTPTEQKGIVDFAPAVKGVVK